MLPERGKQYWKRTCVESIPRPLLSASEQSSKANRGSNYSVGVDSFVAR